MKKTFIYSLVLAAVLAGCGDSVKEAANSVSEKAKEGTSHVVEATKEAASEAAKGAAEAVSDGKNVVAAAKEAVVDTTSKAVDATKEAAGEAVEATKEAASSAVDSAKEVASRAVESTKEAASTAVAAVTGGGAGEAVYKKCSGCHGAKAEKKALGKSQIIAGWDSAKTEDALKGYKAGTYGGSMKGVMKGQVMTMSDEDIKAVAEYISTLK